MLTIRLRRLTCNCLQISDLLVLRPRLQIVIYSKYCVSTSFTQEFNNGLLKNQSKHVKPLTVPKISNISNVGLKKTDDVGIIEYSYRIFRTNPERYPFELLPRIPVSDDQAELTKEIRSKEHARKALKVFLLSTKHQPVDRNVLKDIELHVPKFSRSELLESVICLLQSHESLSHNGIFFQNLQKSLDKACSRSFSINDGQYSDHFIMANAWFRIGLRTTKTITSWRCDYIRTFTAAFCSDKIVPSLNEGQFVFLVFVMGMNRQNPLNIHGLSGSFGRKMSSIVSNLNFGELSLVAHGVHMLKFRLDKHDKEIRKALLKSLAEGDMRSILAQNQEIGIGFIAKVLRERGAGEFSALARILQNLHPFLGAFSPYTNIRILAMVCEYPLGSSPRFISDLLRTIEKHLPILRLKDFVQILRSLHFSNCNENRPFCRRLMALMKDDLRSHPKSGKMFIQTISLLASERVFNDDYLNEIFTKTNQCPELGSETDVTKLLPVIVRFSFEFSRSNSTKEARDRIVQFESSMSKTALFNTLTHIGCLDINMRLDYPEYRGTRLDPKLRERLLSLIMKEKDNSWSSSARQHILDDLRTIFPQNVGFEYLLPHSGSRDFVLAMKLPENEKKLHSANLEFWQDSVIQFPYEQYWNNLKQDKILTLQDLFGATDVTYVALVSPKRDELDSRYEPCGQAFNKMRQLKLLGFSVAMIPQIPYLKVRQNSSGRDYLVKCIAKTAFSKSK